MFVKFQHSDPNCLRIFNSTNTIQPSVRVSVTLPLKKRNGEPRRRHQKQGTERTGGGRKPENGGFVKGTRGRGEKDDRFGCVSGARSGAFTSNNGAREREVVNRDCLLGNHSGRTDKHEEINVILEPAGVVNGAMHESCPRNLSHKFGGNGVWRREKVNRLGKSGGETENFGRRSGGAAPRPAVEELHTECSTKWRRYGGSIPAMLEALEKVHDLDEALKPWILTLTNKERSILLKEQVRWERAMEVFEWFKEKGCYEVNVIHYNIVLRILGRAGQWREVERLCGEMAERGIELINSTYGTLIDVYSKGGFREKAVEWLESMNEHGMQPDEVTMGIVVQMYKKAGDYEMAEKYFKKWSGGKQGGKECGVVRSNRKAGVNGDSSDNVYLSAYTYNTLIDTFGKGGKLREASETFEGMLEKGILPNTVTFNTLMHMYGNNGELDKVVLMMKRMEEAGCTPDTRTYNILISLHAKRNDIELAARYLTKMKESSLIPDVVSYRTLLYAFSIRHMVAEAEELILEMDERGLEIDEYTQSSVTRMYIEAKMLDRSWFWFQRFHHGGNMTSECYSANIDAFGERGYILEAEKVFDCCLKVKKMMVLEFNVMIKACGISQKYEQACCLFDSMVKHGLVPDRCSYNSLVQMLASADLTQKAITYLRKMQEVGLVDDCIPYCAVISCCTRMGDTDLAVGLFEEMIGYGIKPDVVVYGVLINAFAETGSVDKATYYVKSMRNVGLPLNAIICKSLIKLYTKVGHVNEANTVYKVLQSLEVGIDAYSSNCMIDLYSKWSMIPEAEEIFESLKQNGDANEFTYAMMLCMYKRNGMFVRAFRIARQMRELGLMTDLLSYNHVLGLYASDGRYKEAVMTFQDMMGSHIQPDDSTFKSLGNILLKCGVTKDAIDRLDLMRKRDRENGMLAWASTVSSVTEMDSGNGAKV